MNSIISFLAKAASSPIVTNLLVPAISDALVKVCDRFAKWYDMRGAKAAAAHAQTAEELLAASAKIKSAMDRRK